MTDTQIETFRATRDRPLHVSITRGVGAAVALDETISMKQERPSARVHNPVLPDQIGRDGDEGSEFVSREVVRDRQFG
jgi:hypothetical protein